MRTAWRCHRRPLSTDWRPSDGRDDSSAWSSRTVVLPSSTPLTIPPAPRRWRRFWRNAVSGDRSFSRPCEIKMLAVFCRPSYRTSAAWCLLAQRRHGQPTPTHCWKLRRRSCPTRLCTRRIPSAARSVTRGSSAPTSSSRGQFFSSATSSRSSSGRDTLGSSPTVRRHLFLWLIAALPLASAAPLFAQSAISIPGYDIKALMQDRLDDNHGLLLRGVELTQGDTSLYADEVEVFEGQDRVLARGNVLLIQGNNRIAADHAEF